MRCSFKVALGEAAGAIGTRHSSRLPFNTPPSRYHGGKLGQKDEDGQASESLP